MSCDQLRACVQGYGDRLFDLRILGVQTGFWSGYWGNSNRKKPKSLKAILDSIMKSRTRSHTDTVDVESFLATEAKFKSRQQRGGGQSE